MFTREVASMVLRTGLSEDALRFRRYVNVCAALSRLPLPAFMLEVGRRSGLGRPFIILYNTGNDDGRIEPMVCTCIKDMMEQVVGDKYTVPPELLAA